MRKNKYLKYFLLFLLIGCKMYSQKNYKIIYIENNKTISNHYFNSNNEEYSRAYINMGDSLTFKKNQNNLVVSEYHFNPENNKRDLKGEIQYIDYYTNISDIKIEGNVLHVDELPITKNNFFLKDSLLVYTLVENCTGAKQKLGTQFSDCNFRLPKELNSLYFPENSMVHSGIVKYGSKGRIENIILKMSHFNKNYDYTVLYKKTKKKYTRLISIKDSKSTSNYKDEYILAN